MRTDTVVRARKNRDHGKGGTEMDQTKIERGRRQEGEKGTIKNSCAGSREGGSWPGGAGAQDPAHVAQPGPAPSVVQLPHSGPYHEVSPALRLWENNEKSFIVIRFYQSSQGKKLLIPTHLE